MNDYQKEVLRVMKEMNEMDGERVLTNSWEDLIAQTFKAEPGVELAFAIREINLN